MKKLFLLFLGVALAAPLAFGDNGFGIGAAYWDTADAGDAWGAGLKTRVQMVEGVQFDLRASFFNSLGEDSDDVSVDLEVIPLEAGLALELPVADRLDVYAGGGIGYYLMEGDAGGPNQELVDVDPDNEVGFYLVAGSEFVLRRSDAVYGQTAAALFAEVMFRSVSADSAKVEGGQEIRVDDADLDGLGVNVGLLMRW